MSKQTVSAGVIKQTVTTSSFHVTDQGKMPLFNAQRPQGRELTAVWSQYRAAARPLTSMNLQQRIKINWHWIQEYLLVMYVAWDKNSKTNIMYQQQ